MPDLDPKWSGPDGVFTVPDPDAPPPTKKQLRDWKYPPGIPRPGTRIPANGRSSNLGVIGFETDDDETTQQVLDLLTELLLKLKRDQFPKLIWNATEEHYRTRWTRFQMIGDR